MYGWKGEEGWEKQRTSLKGLDRAVVSAGEGLRRNVTADFKKSREISKTLGPTSRIRGSPFENSTTPTETGLLCVFMALFDCLFRITADVSRMQPTSLEQVLEKFRSSTS